MTEILHSSDVESSPVVDAIKSLEMYQSYLKERMTLEDDSDGIPPVIKEAHQAPRRNGAPRSTHRLAGHILHLPPSIEKVPQVIEQPQPIREVGSVSLLDIYNTDVSCRNVDPEVFQVEGRLINKEVKLAKTICMGCAAVERCRAYGIENKDEYGIWGGLTRNERRAAWKKQNKSSNLTRGAQ